MALVKKRQISGQPAAEVIPITDAGTGGKLLAEAQKRKARTFARQQKAAERIAAATAELASGIAEAASAAEELRKACEQIASGAEEAAGAAQQSMKAVVHGGGLILKARDNADVSVTKAEALQTLIANVASQLANSILSISRASDRQIASVKMVEELDRQAGLAGDRALLRQALRLHRKFGGSDSGCGAGSACGDRDGCRCLSGRNGPFHD